MASNASTTFRVRKLSDNAVLPVRGSPLAAGYDLSSAHDVVIPAKGKAIAKTDLAIAVPEGTYGRVAPRSGLAWKHFIDVGAGVIDADYRGNVGVVLYNHSDVDFAVSAGDRVAQLILERIVTPDVVLVDDLDDTERGAGLSRLDSASRRGLVARLELHNELTDELEADMMAAVAFTMETHPQDVRRLDARTTLVASFDEFLYEYAYVVVASGFKAEFAARVVPSLLAAAPDTGAMASFFKNKAKVAAIARVAQMRSEWPSLRASFKSPDDLMRLPRIGPVVKLHLARNIGLQSCVKPDVHMVSYAYKRGWDDPVALITELADAYGLPVGSLDFCVWVWISHGFGTRPNPKCCYGAADLR